ncbi:PPC domain-containing DNA-binding protein [Catenisphaera adipataccumulans]|uniref:PPC domain-containing protein n=1 Tax=Catenisphaera adipataccumulans TaxID=700500 RepID=A0A7W8CXH5_9FIRM|nr:PPC domain-containing DNA-binding protein [Catenisphaera adipataccumulans]MBB5183151.1 hypothetical protein [Catenisphaera adipataccumulans]
MEYKKFDSVYVVRIDRGEEVMEQLKKFAEAEAIQTAKIEGLGAADHVEMGLYDVGKQAYESHTFDQPMEISQINGSITRAGGEPYFHLHINVCDEKQISYGGHLNACRISGTCELFVTVIDGCVGRQKDPKGTGLNVFQF